MSTGLLARMRRREQGAPPLDRPASILAHLVQLLNARQGDSAVDPSYGLPDLTDLAHRVPEGLPVLQRSIAETIQRHESRLKNVSVLPDARMQQKLTLHFEVRAELVTGGSVRFHTEVSPGGRVHVS